MRSMHVIGSHEEGGAERFFLRLTRALTGLGEELLCVLRPGSRLRGRLAPPVRHEAVRMRSILDPFARARISALSRAFGAQVVQTYMGRATRLTRLPRVGGPLHVARVGGYHDVKPLRHAHAWIASTHGIREHLLEAGLPPERVFRIGNVTEARRPPGQGDRAQTRAALGVPDSALLLACLGRLHRDRGVDLLLHALARLPAPTAGAPTHLLVVGQGPEEDALRALAAGLGVAQRVHFVPEPGPPGPYLQAADLFVYPSRDAPVGTAILEAWNQGVPVVATRTLGPAELVRDGVDGVLVPVEDPDALARAIGDLAGAAPALRAALVRRGRERVDAEFSGHAVARAHLEVYSQLLARPD